MDRSKIALFIDVENLTHWLKNNGPDLLITELSAIGQLVVRRAYGNWGNPCVQGFQSELNRLGFELIHNFHPVSKKNSSDIQLTIDVIDYAHNLPGIQWFVLATGDSDFSPLFRKLREMGKEVIGVGPRSPLSESVKTSCSKYLYTGTEHTASKKELRSNTDDAMDLAEKILRAADQTLPLSTLKNGMLSVDSAFNERDLGYRSFIDFLKAIDSVEVAQDGKNKSWTATLKGSDSAGEAREENLQDSLVRSYERLLRKKQWRLTSSKALNEVYQLARQHPRQSKERITEEARKHSQMLTSVEINKALIILVRSKVLRVSGFSDAGEKLWSIDPELNLARTVDAAMLSRLFSACRENATKIEKAALRDLLYGKYDHNALEQLIEQASALQEKAEA
ncbi:NYN domain-containing protein [Azotobacter chroococcum subsp. isscasi]|uniref:NYN domain-containing protein n=1 Tax=Azotobacter chroococcum TaxID=353 RepID=UPI00103EE4B0|nr:NYN domain-containing protein [Azotobacter chroococcum]TBW10578.1 NYN domain-containing protein [Azotobacter chroococcum subsp. isscasi]